MSSVSRKFRRARKREAEKDMQEKLSLMGNMPDSCLSCEAKFDRNSKEQVSSWRVVVREQEGKVNLYCPSCWDKAVNLLKEIEKDMENKNV